MRRAREEGHEGTTAGAAKGGYGGDVGESGSIIDDTPLTDLHESEHDNRIVTSMAASTLMSMPTIRIAIELRQFRHIAEGGVNSGMGFEHQFSA